MSYLLVDHENSERRCSRRMMEAVPLRGACLLPGNARCWARLTERRRRGRQGVWTGAVCAAVALATAAVVVALPITQWDKIDTKGNWNIYKDPHPVPDKSRCVAIYDRDYHIQLTGDGLTFAYGMKGGIDSAHWRVDQGEPRSGVALGRERNLGAFVITDDGGRGTSGAFLEILHGKQLHIELARLVGDPVSFDLTLAGIRAAMDVLWGPQCS
jgi:hypothetical protein